MTNNLKRYLFIFAVLLCGQCAENPIFDLAEILRKKMAKTYAKTAQQLKSKINTVFWSDNFNSYADFIGTDEQALHLNTDAMVRGETLNKPWAIEEMEQTRQFILNNPSNKFRPFVLHHNWVMNTPLEMGIADTAKALKAVETRKTFVNPFGVFVKGIDIDASAGAYKNTYKAPPIFN